jgi:hypothetical protein
MSDKVGVRMADQAIQGSQQKSTSFPLATVLATVQWGYSYCPLSCCFLGLLPQMQCT